MEIDGCFKANDNSQVLLPPWPSDWKSARVVNKMLPGVETSSANSIRVDTQRR